jgi:hypothetical protein
VTYLDSAFAQLSQMPSPKAIGSLDDAVLASLAERQQDNAAARPLMGIAAMMALGIGVVGGSVVSDPAGAAKPLSPFAPASTLAPSTLLDVRQ